MHVPRYRNPFESEGHNPPDEDHFVDEPEIFIRDLAQERSIDTENYARSEEEGWFYGDED